MLKILMLHGYAQNASIFSKKCGALRKSAKGIAEFYFYDAPHIILTPTFGTDNSQFDSEANAESDDPALKPRTWWQRPKETQKYEGFDESVKFIKEKNEEVGGFDGIIGFSLGAHFAAMLTAIFLRPDLHPTFTNSSVPIKPFKFCWLISGGVSTDPDHKKYFTPTFNQDPESKRITEVVIVIGETDSIVLPERSEAFIPLARNPRVEYHTGSHFVPAKANWRVFYRDYLDSFTKEDGATLRAGMLGPKARGAVVE